MLCSKIDIFINYLYFYQKLVPLNCNFAKLSSEESYLVMKVIIVERSDGLWGFACGDVSSPYNCPGHQSWSPLYAPSATKLYNHSD